MSKVAFRSNFSFQQNSMNLLLECIFKMFHCKNEKLSAENSEKILRKAFLKESSDKKIIYKVDFKVIWLYLFGYKISKVNHSFL